MAAPDAVAAPAAVAPATREETPKLFPADSDSVVDAANAFLATLSDEQRKTAIIELTPQNAARWSNFPAAVVRRNGIFLRDMDPTQVAAALKVARVALSKDGFVRFEGVRAADDAFGASNEAKGGPGGSGNRGGGNRGGGNRGGGNRGGGNRGGAPIGGGFGQFGADGDNGGGPNGGNFGSPGQLFGNANYIIAFLGTPAKTAPWMLQIGGHHLAFNLTYKGKVGASTPYFVGVQPNIWKDADGKTHEPLAPMHNAMHNLVNSLAPAQLAQAKLSGRYSDVYVGPGKDARFPAKSEGVAVSQLSDASKDLVKKAMAAWTGDAFRARNIASSTKANWLKPKSGIRAARRSTAEAITFALTGRTFGSSSRVRPATITTRFGATARPIMAPSSPSKMPLRLYFLALLLLLMAVPAWSHPMPNSAVELRFYRTHVEAELTLPISELALGWEKPLPRDAVQTVRQFGVPLRNYLRAHISATAPDGQLWTVNIGEITPVVEQTPDVRMALTLAPPAGAPADRLTLHYDAIFHHLVTHTAIVTLESDWHNGVIGENPIVLGTMRDTSSALEIDRSGGSWLVGFAAMFRLAATAPMAATKVAVAVAKVAAQIWPVVATMMVAPTLVAPA